MIKRLETKPYEGTLKEMDMFNLEKKRTRGDLITIFKYSTGSHTEEVQDLFLIIPETRFRLNIRKKNFIIVRAVQQWN